MTHAQAKPYFWTCEDGQCLSSLETRVVIKATSEQTDGAFNLFEVFCPPGFATSLDLHYAEDVAIYALEGTLTVYWGSESRKATAGSYSYQPRGIPHGFRVNGATSARLLYMTFPAGLDRFLVEQGQLASDRESATPAARYKIEILGPLAE